MISTDSALAHELCQVIITQDRNPELATSAALDHLLIEPLVDDQTVALVSHDPSLHPVANTVFAYLKQYAPQRIIFTQAFRSDANVIICLASLVTLPKKLNLISLMIIAAPPLCLAGFNPQATIAVVDMLAGRPPTYDLSAVFFPVLSPQQVAHYF